MSPRLGIQSWFDGTTQWSYLESSEEVNVITPEQAAVSYNYTWPLVMLACLGVAALIIGIILKRVDKVKGLGLELPNVQQ